MRVEAASRIYMYFSRHETAVIGRAGGIHVYIRRTGTTQSRHELLQEFLGSDEVDPQKQDCSSQRLLGTAETEGDATILAVFYTSDDSLSCLGRERLRVH